MGREVKRVPVDFDWPLNKAWQGYLMPESLRETSCEQCAGRGMTPARAWLTACAYAITMLQDDLRQQQLGRRMHPYFDDFPTMAYGTRPSSDIAEVVDGLCDGGTSFPGRSSTDAWRATRKIVTAAGLDEDAWGWCAACDAHGSVETYPGQRADAEAWEREDPPTGDGWQLWETVSEGSPISPVFPTTDGLIDWLCSPAYTWGTSTPMQRDQAERFVNSGWAPSLVFTAATGVIPGEQFVGGRAGEAS